MILYVMNFLLLAAFSTGREPIGSSGSDTSKTAAEQSKASVVEERFKRVIQKRKAIFIKDANGGYCFHKQHGYMECDEFFALKNIDQNNDSIEDEPKISKTDNPTDCAQSKMLSWPIVSELTSPYGMRKHPRYKKRKMHTGCDFDAEHGDPIRAAATGKMECDFGKCKKKRKKRCTKYSGYGIQVNIFHENGLSTKYAHLKSIESSLCGQQVRAGAIIGYTDNTGVSEGDHLHFEVRCNNEHKDPMKYLGEKVNPPLTPMDSRSNVQ